ncbi:MAG: cytochrome C [Rhodobacterales bacterium CG18_big_fil_WC_8_21_14_2_50_71_9]|nr:MAG: cytochrome C [Rhodobacterales bacterium CG18_big_fil_WC_8_21_14_2_50_71_9]PJA60538.1 MAG: cytochrome C [Rhodobacterales bacterium CG_4_9_14_3_um_filter_71_31]
MKSIAACAIVALLATAAGYTAGHAAETLDKARTAAGEILFRDKCRICHAPDADTASYGPTLTGVVGRPAGAYPGYAYSQALQNVGFVWTPEALRAWMANNDGFMPGTKMRHVGVTDSAEQDFILAYLQSISRR